MQNEEKLNTTNNISAPIGLDYFSGVSLYLQLFVNSQHLGQATGFVIENNNKKYLIANWHVVSGRDTITGKPLSKTGGLPDKINIAHHSSSDFGTWWFINEPLYDGEKQLWLEHPKSTESNRIDVVVLPLTRTEEKLAFVPLNLNLAKSDMVAHPAQTVSIIGYPLGLSADDKVLIPIWKTGHIASDVELNENFFLIDATTKSGMSGSPVIMRSSGGFQTKNGSWIMAMAGMRELFLGVYSGRIHELSEIGKVWKPKLIEEILNAR
ncbi:MAG: serine protease [Patescibacteria group bacterium]